MVTAPPSPLSPRTHMPMAPAPPARRRLLHTLYCDYDARQQQPPPFPSPPEPWGENLRALGPPPPRVNGGIAELADAGDGPLSSTSANAGLAPRSLHDEAVQEGIILAADPLLDVGMRAVRWFEDIASEEAGAPLPQDASSRATAVALKSRGAAAAAADGLPSSIDPDAPSYERAALAPSDDDEAAYLMRTLWRLIRAGRVSDAADFCRQCRQWWRAASLGGGSPFRYDPTSATWTGNPDRPLWRRACMVIAKRANRRAGVESAAAVAAAHEAAVYAALGGGEEVRNTAPRRQISPTHRAHAQAACRPRQYLGRVSQAIPLVLGACDGWKDEVWANLKLGLATAMSARAQLVCDGRTPQQLQLNALRSVFERAAGAPGDADAARAHFAMQARRGPPQARDVAEIPCASLHAWPHPPPLARRRASYSSAARSSPRAMWRAPMAGARAPKRPWRSYAAFSRSA